ncbi:MAG: putative transport system ATP-binding protein [Acidimicrobiaceae bacterium]
MLEAQGLYRFFHQGDEEVVALAGVSLKVELGELVAVQGPSGSGKSTLLACLAGLDDPDGGTVRVGGRVVSRRPEPERAALRARDIGLLFQTATLLDHLTVDENITFVQRLARRADRGRSDELLEQLRLSHRRGALPKELSGGEVARAGLAVACANHPTVLLADEPTGEVDSVIETDVITLLRRQAREGAAVVVVTHSDAVSSAADRVVHMDDGRFVA